MNTPVSFPLAQLLKEKGYKGQTHVDHRYDPLYYHTSGELHLHNWFNSFDSMIKAPTIAEVVMWLYEKYGIWISVVPYKDEELSQTLWENKITHISDDYNDCSDFTFYHSPKEAYEAAIEYCLKNLI